MPWGLTHPGRELRRSIEEAREAWSLLEEKALPPGAARVGEGIPWCAVTPSSV